MQVEAGYVLHEATAAPRESPVRECDSHPEHVVARRSDKRAVPTGHAGSECAAEGGVGWAGDRGGEGVPMDADSFFELGEVAARLGRECSVAGDVGDDVREPACR